MKNVKNSAHKNDERNDRQQNESIRYFDLNVLDNSLNIHLCFVPENYSRKKRKIFILASC